MLVLDLVGRRVEPNVIEYAAAFAFGERNHVDADRFAAGITHGADIATEKRRIEAPGGDARVFETEYDYIEIRCDCRLPRFIAGKRSAGFRFLKGPAITASSVPIPAGGGKWKRTFSPNPRKWKRAIRYATAILRPHRPHRSVAVSGLMS